MNNKEQKNNFVIENILSLLTLGFIAWQIPLHTTIPLTWLYFIPILLGTILLFVGRKVEISRITLYFIGLSISWILLTRTSPNTSRYLLLALLRIAYHLSWFSLPPLILHTLFNYYSQYHSSSEQNKSIKILIYIPFLLLVFAHINFLLSFISIPGMQNKIFIKFIKFLRNFPLRYYIIPYIFFSILSIIGLIVKLLKALKKSQSEESDDKEELAEQLVNQGQYTQAIAIYETKKNWSDAAILYHKIGDYHSAANVYFKAKDYNNAGEMYIKNSEPKKAVEMFLKSDNYIRAAETYNMLNEINEAAKLYEKNNSYFKAAELYHKDKNFEKALTMYEKANILPPLELFELTEEWEEAIIFYEKKGAKEQIIKILVEKLNKIKEAAELLEKNDKLLEAAILYERLEDYEHSLILYEQIGEVEQVIRLLKEKINNQERLAEYLLEKNRLEDAALIYIELKNWDLAIKIYTQLHNTTAILDILVNELEDYTNAAIKLEEIANLERAGEMWELANNMIKAKECYEKNENLSKLANVYRKENNNEKAVYYWEEYFKRKPDNVSIRYELGLAYYDLENWDKVIYHFQHLLKSGNYPNEIFIYIAKSFKAKEEYAIAIDNYESIIETLGGKNTQNLYLMYDLADTYELNNQQNEAQSIFQEILNIDYNFKDSKKRYDNITNIIAEDTSGNVTQLAKTDNEKIISERFEILSELGKGGMGIVYKAKDKKLDRIVALKRLTDELVNNEVYHKRFMREARASASLNHDNIVSIYDIDDIANVIVMEYVDGDSVRILLEKQKHISIVNALKICIQVANALHIAHQKKIVHRDIKPENVMITKKGKVKVMDFGIAHLSGETITSTGVIIGTLGYMSPEQLKGIKEIDARSDIYSLGIMLYELISGRRPFSSKNVQYMSLVDIFKVKDEKTKVYIGNLDNIIQKAISESPANRYQNAADFGTAMLKLVANNQH